MVTEITLMNWREYSWASGLALYKEIKPSRKRNTAAPEMRPTKEKDHLHGFRVFLHLLILAGAHGLAGDDAHRRGHAVHPNVDQVVEHPCDAGRRDDPRAVIPQNLGVGQGIDRPHILPADNGQAIAVKNPAKAGHPYGEDPSIQSEAFYSTKNTYQC